MRMLLSFLNKYWTTIIIAFAIIVFIIVSTSCKPTFMQAGSTIIKGKHHKITFGIKKQTWKRSHFYLPKPNKDSI